MKIVNAIRRLFRKWDLPAHDIKWYPAGKTIPGKNDKLHTAQEPPLMVRRAEWRR